MYDHQPPQYECPFCKVLSGTGDQYTQQEDIVYKDAFATAVIAPRWWVNNPGSVLVIPNQHFENIYDMPDEQLAGVYKVVKKIAVAIRKTYGCAGTSTRQHNEPAGGQDVWHLHVQVLPRYENDQLYQLTDQHEFVDADQRAPYARKLRAYFEAQS